MRILTRASALPALAVLALTLAACSSDPAAPTQGGDEPATAQPAPTTSADPAGGDEPAQGACPEVPQEGYDLFSSDVVSKAPEEGQVFGGADHPISWTFSEELEWGADVNFYYINEAGDAITITGMFLEDLGGNEWGTSNEIFASDADGRPGFAELGVTWDASVGDDGAITGDHEVVGMYCITYKVSE